MHTFQWSEISTNNYGLIILQRPEWLIDLSVGKKAFCVHVKLVFPETTVKH